MREETQVKKFDLEERLVNFAVRIARIAESLPNTRTGNHIAGQLVRSGTSPAFNYGEAQSAESGNDFIHKIKIVLKELRESNVSLKIIRRPTLITPPERVDPVMDEANPFDSNICQEH